MDRSALTPAQLDVVDHLLAMGQARPTFAEDLAIRLLDLLEDGLAPVFQLLGPVELTVNKTALAQVHACEAHHLAESDVPFDWTVANCRGTVAHRALELAVFRPRGGTTGGSREASPLELVDEAINRLIQSGEDWSPRDFLRGADLAELAEVRGGACDVVTKFQECFPPLAAAWRPRLESSCRVELGASSVVLRSNVDLALGRPVGHEARVLIVDVKTGRPYPTHLDDLRYYALLETLRSKVPPFRVASYYLESARWQAEDITEELLVVAAHRVVDGVTKLAELRLGVRAPTTNAGPACTYCRLRGGCAGAQEWIELRERVGEF
ncbi:MAG TPA: PD-(D/E)XK nuclease family protein [Acidimicrobiales bacterium]|nr:PD-(D/E)XK nuclease family protein [Acidimicrobiales bacterium]